MAADDEAFVVWAPNEANRAEAVGNAKAWLLETGSTAEIEDTVALEIDLQKHVRVVVTFRWPDGRVLGCWLPIIRENAHDYIWPWSWLQETPTVPEPAEDDR